MFVCITRLAVDSNREAFFPVLIVVPAMQREFIRYNRKVLGKPEIFGRSAKGVPFVGGAEDQENLEDNDDVQDVEDRYDDIEDEQSELCAASASCIDIDVTQDEIKEKADGENNPDDPDEIDPLDLYMQEIDEKLKQEAANRVGSKRKSVSV